MRLIHLVANIIVVALFQSDSVALCILYCRPFGKKRIAPETALRIHQTIVAAQIRFLKFFVLFTISPSFFPIYSGFKHINSHKSSP